MSEIRQGMDQRIWTSWTRHTRCSHCYFCLVSWKEAPRALKLSAARAVWALNPAHRAKWTHFCSRRTGQRASSSKIHPLSPCFSESAWTSEILLPVLKLLPLAAAFFRESVPTGEPRTWKRASRGENWCSGRRRRLQTLTWWGVHQEWEVER